LSICVSDLSFSYGDARVLKDVSFSVGEGELMSVVGPNGVGKSTLFYCLLGIFDNYKGKISIKDIDIKNLGVQEMAKLIAYVPQSHFPSFNFSVFDMVLLGTSVQISSVSTPGKKQIQLAESAMDRLGISHLRERGYTKISGGERQLALIARALVQQTNVLILDEPTANLDFGNQIRVLEQIRSLTKEGYTIIQSTHNPEQAFMYSDRVLAMHRGRVLADGSPSEIVTEELVHKLYGVDVKIKSLYRDKVRVCIPENLIKEEIQYTSFNIKSNYQEEVSA
jgi:iron complex transport system ATP-binding protein